MEAQLSAQCLDDTQAVGMGPQKRKQGRQGSGVKVLSHGPGSTVSPGHHRHQVTTWGCPSSPGMRDSYVHVETLAPRETGHPGQSMTQVLLA